MKVILKEIKKNTTNSLFKWDWRTFIHMREEKRAENQCLKHGLKKRRKAKASIKIKRNCRKDSQVSRRTMLLLIQWMRADTAQLLVSLTDGDLTSVVNPETALVMYKELVYRIDENALDFKRAGVTKGELLGELKETKKTLETTSFASTNANQTDINEQKKQEILNNISSAKEHVQVAFESRGTGGDADAE